MKKNFFAVFFGAFAAVICLSICCNAAGIETDRCEVISGDGESALLISVSNTDTDTKNATLLFAAYSGQKICGLKTKTVSLASGEKKFVMLNDFETPDSCDSIEAWVIDGWNSHVTVLPAKKFTAEDTKLNYIYDESFDKISSYSQTGISWAGKDSKNTLTLEKDGEDGWLLIHSETSDPILIKALNVQEKKFVVELKCKVQAQPESRVTLAAIRSAGNVQNALAYTDDSGKLFDAAGGEIGSLNGEGLTRVSFAVNMDDQKYDAYVDGKLCKTDIPFVNAYGADDSISEIRILSRGKVDTVVDDMKVYGGLCALSLGDGVGDWEYSETSTEPEPEPEPEPEKDIYFESFDSRNAFSEIGWNFAQKDSKNLALIEAQGEVGNKCLKLHVEADQPILYKAIEGIDTSVTIEADFKCSDGMTMQTVPLMLRTKNGKGSSFVRILSGGKITSSDRENVVGQMNADGFTNIKVKLDNAVYSIIIDGVTAAENLPIPTALDDGDSYSEWRLTGFGGKGDLYVDNMKISK